MHCKARVMGSWLGLRLKPLAQDTTARSPSKGEAKGDNQMIPPMGHLRDHPRQRFERGKREEAHCSAKGRTAPSAAPSWSSEQQPCSWDVSPPTKPLRNSGDAGQCWQQLSQDAMSGPVNISRYIVRTSKAGKWISRFDVAQCWLWDRCLTDTAWKGMNSLSRVMALPSGDVRDAGTAPQAQNGGILALLPLQPWMLPRQQPCCPWLL